MLRITVLVAAIAASLTVVLAAAAQTNVATLTGTVGPGFTITLKDSGGDKVKTLKHGKYKIVVHDKSNIHDFHLKGPGVNQKITGVKFKGTKSVTLTLKAGKYTYVCDPHAAAMRGSFKVT